MALTPRETVDAIADLNHRIAEFWGSAAWWAPLEAAHLLSKSRLDWQVELSRALGLWIDPPEPGLENAHLILSWANLGALVEGTLKWFLSVYYDTYKADIDVLKDRLGNIIEPDSLTLEPLRQFYSKRVWVNGDGRDAWILHIQQRRNAIHAYRDRALGSHDEWLEDVSYYFDILGELNGRAPYP